MAGCQQLDMAFGGRGVFIERHRDADTSTNITNLIAQISMAFHAIRCHHHGADQPYIGLAVYVGKFADFFSTLFECVDGGFFPGVSLVMWIEEFDADNAPSDTVELPVFIHHLAQHVSRIHQGKLHAAGGDDIAIGYVCHVRAGRGVSRRLYIHTAFFTGPETKGLIFEKRGAGGIHGQSACFLVDGIDVPVQG